MEKENDYPWDFIQQLYNDVHRFQLVNFIVLNSYMSIYSRRGDYKTCLSILKTIHTQFPNDLNINCICNYMNSINKSNLIQQDKFKWADYATPYLNINQNTKPHVCSI